LVSYKSVPFGILAWSRPVQISTSKIASLRSGRFIAVVPRKFIKIQVFYSGTASEKFTFHWVQGPPISLFLVFLVFTGLAHTVPTETWCKNTFSLKTVNID